MGAFFLQLQREFHGRRYVCHVIIDRFSPSIMGSAKPYLLKLLKAEPPAAPTGSYVEFSLTC